MKHGSSFSSSSTPPHAVLMQAAEWYACLRDGKASAEQRSAWQSWLKQDEMHSTAWRYVEEVSRSFEPVRSVPDSRCVVEKLHTANERLHQRRRVLAGVVALAGTGVASWLSWRQSWLPSSVLALAADHSTQTGEQNQIVLADGSRLWLNTSSAIDVKFTAQARHIVLMSGEIFIQTAKDDMDRPFTVQTPQGYMRALGTQFNVRMDQDCTQLAVYEGAVQVSTAKGQNTATVQAGKQVHFSAQRIRHSMDAEQAREAWTKGVLVADNIALRSVIKELGRYRKGYLGVDDAVADLKVYGSFPIHDTDRVLKMLASALPIRIDQPMPWWTSVQALD
ncbi:FecR domain-containing protein [Alcaligenes sp. MMA]|uniref:FecR domain-containing protein n=1 Tax=Alcaligenes sp. MMA TaxID=2893019 RepID=UPI001E639355|nr:FecR domain-containing protein [Alcaligenes sp. MMA]MCC9164748.1 FecR domain-containing protein [Alcaligenes sp. MMA]